MQRGPGEWYKQFVTEGKKDLTGSEDTLASFGEDISNKVLESAQVHVSSFSVIITTMGKEHGRKPLENMRPASGVIVPNPRPNVWHFDRGPCAAPEQEHKRQGRGNIAGILAGLGPPRRSCFHPPFAETVHFGWIPQ